MPPILCPLQRRRERNGTTSSAGSADVDAGSASATARSVRFCASDAAAKRPRASPSSSSLVPAAGRSSTSRSEAVVRVPVLSTQIVSTDASDSIAFSCCESAPERAIRSAAAA